MTFPSRPCFCPILVILVIWGSPWIEGARGQERLTNAGFEAGPLAGAGTISFAGGTQNAVGLDLRTPDHWLYEASSNGDTDLWVESPQARSGSRYLFLSSTGTTEGGNDDCLRNIAPSTIRTISGLNGSVPATNTLRISIWAANGQADPSQLNLEIRQFDAGGDILTPSLVNQDPNVIQDFNLLYRPFTINPNSNGWTPTTTAVAGGIPWLQYWVDILLLPNAWAADVWYSAAEPSSIAGVQRSSIVLDDASLTVVPEPSLPALLWLTLATRLRRRRCRTHA